MIIRMFEYGFRKGKENADYGGDNIKKLYFPKQKVIFFEENKNIEDSLKLMIVFGDEKEFLYEVDVMKYWEYNDKDLIEKKMYPLIPLQLFNLRKKLNYAKKKNDINEGKWIGVGGHAENGESPEDCLLREVKEETGLTLTSYRFRALITFISDKQEPELMCLFTADEFSGKLITCNEGDLKWVDKTIVPTLPTWEGDAIFLKLLLENEENFFTLKLVYEGESLVDQKLKIY